MALRLVQDAPARGGLRLVEDAPKPKVSRTPDTSFFREPVSAGGRVGVGGEPVFNSVGATGETRLRLDEEPPAEETPEQARLKRDSAWIDETMRQFTSREGIDALHAEARAAGVPLGRAVRWKRNQLERQAKAGSLQPPETPSLSMADVNEQSTRERAGAIEFADQLRGRIGQWPNTGEGEDPELFSALEVIEQYRKQVAPEVPGPRFMRQLFPREMAQQQERDPNGSWSAAGESLLQSIKQTAAGGAQALGERLRYAGNYIPAVRGLLDTPANFLRTEGYEQGAEALARMNELGAQMAPRPTASVYDDPEGWARYFGQQGVASSGLTLAGMGASLVNPALGAATFLGGAGGSEYGRARIEDGASPSEAGVRALTSAATEGIPEMLGGAAMLGRLPLMGLAQSTARGRAAIAIPTEAGTEGLTEKLNIEAERARGKYISPEEESARIKDAVVIGGMLGGGMGTGSAAIESGARSLQGMYEFAGQAADLTRQARARATTDRILGRTTPPQTPQEAQTDAGAGIAEAAIQNALAARPVVSTIQQNPNTSIPTRIENANSFTSPVAQSDVRENDELDRLLVGALGGAEDGRLANVDAGGVDRLGGAEGARGGPGVDQAAVAENAGEGAFSRDGGSVRNLPDGTYFIPGDPAAIRQRLADAGVETRGVVRTIDEQQGVRFGANTRGQVLGVLGGQYGSGIGGVDSAGSRSASGKYSTDGILGPTEGGARAQQGASQGADAGVAELADARARFRQRISPAVRRDQAVTQKLQSLKQSGQLSDEQIALVRETLSPELSVGTDRVTTFFRSEDLPETMQAAQQYVTETNDDAAYAEIDFANLGGLNAVAGNAGADTHLAAVTRIIKEGLEAAGVDGAVNIRKGGDEFGIVAAGIDAQTLGRVMMGIRQQVAAYADAQGLSGIAHGKDKSLPPGIGIHFATSDIQDGLTVDEIRAQADTLVEARKKGKAGYDEYAGPDAAVGSAQGTDAGSGIGVAAATERGTAGQVGRAQDGAQAGAAAEGGVGEDRAVRSPSIDGGRGSRPGATDGRGSDSPMGRQAAGPVDGDGRVGLEAGRGAEPVRSGGTDGRGARNGDPRSADAPADRGEPIRGRGRDSADGGVSRDAALAEGVSVERQAQTDVGALVDGPAVANGSGRDSANRGDGQAESRMGRETGGTVDAVRSAVSRALGSKFLRRLESQPWFNLVESLDQLPPDVRKSISGDDIAGFVLPDGRVFIIAENVGDNATGIVLHEVGVHFGMAGLPDFPAMLAQFKRLRERDDRVAAAYKRAEAVADRDKNGNLTADAKALLDEEAFAYYVEQNWNAKTPLMTRIKDAIARLLNRLGVPTSGITDALMRQALDGMVQSAREAADKATRGLVTVRDGKIVYHKAWHGSPHDFDKFRLDDSTIGTGEGAQAYGHGLYFAGKRELADWYKVQLSGRTITGVDGSRYGASQKEAEADARRLLLMMRASPKEFAAYDDGGQSYIGKIVRDIKRGKIKADEGRLYEVELAPQESDYLDWDAPLSEQSEKVRDALAPLVDWMLTRPISDSAKTAIRDGVIKGAAFYKQLAGEKSLSQRQAIGNPDILASNELRDAGVPGIRYLDGSSRGKGDGSRNYVLFDDSLVKVQAKYSFAGRNAKTANIGTLEQAQAMIADGASAEDARKATGWFKGRDGKWRFEIDDSGARISSYFANEMLDNSEKRGVYLKSVLDHPALFDAYPDLGMTLVDWKRSGGLGGGDAAFLGNKITLNAPSAKDAFSLLLHEIQHAIQGREGFAKGGSPADPNNVSAADLMREENARFDRMQRDAESSKEYRDFVADFIANIPESERMVPSRRGDGMVDVSRQLAEAAARKRFIEPIERERVAAIDAIAAEDKNGGDIGGLIGYRRLSGETEARNVQTRQRMTAAERRDTSPQSTQDVPDERQVVRYSRRADGGPESLRVVAAGDVVDGRTVREGVPNQSSIASSLDDYTILKGIREVPMSAFDKEYVEGIAEGRIDNRTQALADAIAASKEIAPLIVAYDADGAYIIEGGHRLDALIKIGAKSLPAMVVIDEANPPKPATREGLGASGPRYSRSAIAVDGVERPTADSTEKRTFSSEEIASAGGFEMDIAEVAQNGDDGQSPWLMPDGKIIGTGQDHIGFAEQLADAPDYSTFMGETGAVRAGMFKRRNGDYVVTLHTHKDQVFTPRQIETLRAIEATRGKITVMHGAANGLVNPEYAETSISELPQRRVNSGASIPRYSRRTIEVDGAERPSTDSTGKPIHPTEEGLRNFWRWFGDSKVVDEQGRPLVVYHGTNAEFTEFDPWKKRAGWLGNGFYFTEDAEQAARYGSNVMPVYLAGDRVVNTLTDKIYGDGKRPVTIGRAVVGAGTVYVVDKPDQIKSAESNSGSFSPTDKRIAYSRRTPQRTPEQAAALAKAGMPEDNRTLAQRGKDYIAGQWTNLKSLVSAGDAKQSVFDRFHRMSAIEQELGIPPERSAYISARLAAGLPSIMEGVMMYGAPKWENGVLTVDDQTVGLLDALKPVKDDVNAWLGWMVGRRARALKAQGRENLMTDDDIAALLSLANGRDAEFQDAALKYLRIKNAILDVAEKAGLIDPAGRAVWDSVEYIPFYRQDEAEGDTIGPGTRQGLAGQNSGIRSLKGGKQNLADPLGNIVRNFTRLIDASLKNNAMLEAVDEYGDTFFEKVPMSGTFERVPLSQVKKVLLDRGVPQSVIDQMPQGTLTGLTKLWAIKPPTDDDVVRVMRNGKAEYYRVPDKALLASLTAFRVPAAHWVVSPFKFAKKLLTVGVTTTLEFMGGNFIRDSASSWIISDDKFRLGWDSVKGIISPLMDDTAQKEMMFAGGSFIGGQFYSVGSDEATANAIRRALRDKGLKSKDIEAFIGTIARTPMALWDKWQKIGSYLENANRNAIYENAIKAGRSKKEAAYLARDLMDFSMHGSSQFVQFLSDVLPFFNARLQGLYKLYRQGGKRKLRKALLMRAGTITLGTLALMAFNSIYFADGYDELEEWDKDTYWHIAPGTIFHTRIPKPFELGVLFATIPERIARAITYQVPGGDAGDRPRQTLDSFLTQIGGTLAMNPIPQGVMPIVEQWANKSFFTGRPIENMGDEKLLPEARAEWYTSDTAKVVSDVIGNKTGLSPKRIEHLWNGYTGGIGAYLLETSDWIVRQVQQAPERPELAWAEMPLIKRLYRGDMVPKNTRYMTDFYELKTKAEQVSGTIKEFELAGRKDEAAELEAENAWLLGPRIRSNRAKAEFMHANVRKINKARDELADIRKQIEGIVAMPGFTDERKRREIDALAIKRNEIAREITRFLRSQERQSR